MPVDASPPVRDDSAAYAQLVRRLHVDDRVLGVVLTGSQARDGMATERSDHDVLVITADGAETDLASLARRDAVLDVSVLAWDVFVDHAGVDSPQAWARWSFAYCRVVKDTDDGQVEALCRQKASLSVDEAARLAPAVLDGFLNAVYRSTKNERDGNGIAARLDAAESIGPYLTYVFALHRRVRPYNKYLAWELARHPLGRPQWSADALLPALEAALSAEATTAVRRLLVDLEPVARSAGHGDVLDGWGADLALMLAVRLASS